MKKSPSRITISSDVLFQELDGESVLLNLSSQRYFGLNDSGTRYWQLLSTLGDLDQVVARMVTEYKVEDSTVRDDLINLINRLDESGLLTAKE